MHKPTLPLLLLLAGCAAGVSQSELDSVHYGPRPDNWQQAVRDYLEPRLPDPKRAIVTFRTEPQQMVQKETPMRALEVPARTAAPPRAARGMVALVSFTVATCRSRSSVIGP